MHAPEPTTTKMKKPRSTGLTGGWSSRFCYTCVVFWMMGDRALSVSPSHRHTPPHTPRRVRTAALPTGTLPRLVTFFSYFSERMRVTRLVACVYKGWMWYGEHAKGSVKSGQPKPQAFGPEWIGLRALTGCKVCLPTITRAALCPITMDLHHAIASCTL